MIKKFILSTLMVSSVFGSHTSDFNSLPAHGNLGTEYLVDLAYGYWGIKNSHQKEVSYGLFHLYLNQPIFKDTIVKGEVCASWGLNKRSDYDFNGGLSSITYPNGDIYGSHTGGLPEIAIMQFFDNRHICVTGGIVDFNNVFDAVAWTDNYFTGFANSAFMNSVMLPLVGGNLGAVVQADINETDYVMFGVSRAGRDFCRGTNPLKSVEKDGFSVVGEYGTNVTENCIIRINPFLRYYDKKGNDDSTEDIGIVGSVEYKPFESNTLFMRVGASNHKRTAAYELSGGIRQNTFGKDFIGAAIAVINPKNRGSVVANSRETVFEVMYSLSVGEHLFVVPHVQYITNPTYGKEENKILWGVQSTLSF